MQKVTPKTKKNVQKGTPKKNRSAKADAFGDSSAEGLRLHNVPRPRRWRGGGPAAKKHMYLPPT